MLLLSFHKKWLGSSCFVGSSICSKILVLDDELKHDDWKVHIREKKRKWWKWHSVWGSSPQRPRASLKDRQTGWGPHHDGWSDDAWVPTLWAGVDSGCFLGRARVAAVLQDGSQSDDVGMAKGFVHRRTGVLARGLLMIAFITWNSDLVPLLNGLCSSNPFRFEFSVFWDFAGIESTTSGLTDPRFNQPT